MGGLAPAAAAAAAAAMRPAWSAQAPTYCCRRQGWHRGQRWPRPPCRPPRCMPQGPPPGGSTRLLGQVIDCGIGARGHDGEERLVHCEPNCQALNVGATPSKHACQGGRGGSDGPELAPKLLTQLRLSKALTCSTHQPPSGRRGQPAPSSPATRLIRPASSATNTLSVCLRTPSSSGSAWYSPASSSAADASAAGAAAAMVWEGGSGVTAAACPASTLSRLVAALTLPATSNADRCAAAAAYC